MSDLTSLAALNVNTPSNDTQTIRAELGAEIKAIKEMVKDLYLRDQKFVTFTAAATDASDIFDLNALALAQTPPMSTCARLVCDGITGDLTISEFTGFQNGMWIIIYNADATHNVILDEGTGKISCSTGADVNLDTGEMAFGFFYNDLCYILPKADMEA